jgi:hypothetical protein
MSNPSKPVCRQCVHFRENDEFKFPQCWHADAVVWNPVDGDRPSNARDQRDDGRGQCGLDGKLFEQHVPGPLAEAVGEFLVHLFGGVTKAKEPV